MFQSTKTLVTEIPARAMLDLEEIGGEGFRAEYATFVSVDPTADGLMLVAQHEGTLIALTIPPTTTIPVITYAASSNMLEA